ncbi:MAG: DNA-directed RNA polymerase subunit alpha [Patescibacteria group bacterium]
MNEPVFEIKQEEKKGNYSKFVISPLDVGYGYTLGNSLRRVLLSGLNGAAITSVKISGVKHQFSTLKGAREDVIDFILNLKKVRISYAGDKPVKLTIDAKGPGEVKASEIKGPANAVISNKDLVLTTLDKSAKLDVELEVRSGVGYSPAEERSSGKIGLIPIDAIFSPVARVNYKVEETRVGRLTNYDKLILEVWTDGTITPKDAILEAAKNLVSYFNQIILPKNTKKELSKVVNSPQSLLEKLSVEEVGLPTRIANALVRAGYETVEDLVDAKKEDLVKVRNLGEKSLKVIRLALMEKGVEFKDA